MVWNSLDEVIKFMRNKYPNMNSFSINQFKKYVIFSKEMEGKKVFCIAKKPSKLKINNVNVFNLAKEVWPWAFSKKSMLQASLSHLNRILEN